jgi:hypothetical protein
MGPIQMQCKLEALNADERNLLKLRDRRHREELIARAERLVNEEE